MNPWPQLLDLQALDTSLDQLDRAFETLPERAALAKAQADLVANRAEVAKVEAERETKRKELRRIEIDVETVEAKVAKDEAALYASGADIKSAQALQEEIAHLKARIRGLEDDELEVMELIEPLDAQVIALADAKAVLDEAAIAATAALAVAESTVDGKRTDARAQRSELAGSIDGARVAAYDTARAGLGGTAVARFDHGVCGACHMTLSAMETDRIKHLPPEDEVRCEECDRFLVRS